MNSLNVYRTRMTSRDIFETKYPNLYKVKDSKERVYINDILNDNWEKSLLGMFDKWVFVLNLLFDEEELSFYETRIRFNHSLLTFNDETIEWIYKLLNLEQKKD